MSKKMGAIIAAYGLLISVLALSLRFTAPQETATVLVTFIAGLLSLGCGVAIWTGRKRRAWIVLVSVAFTLFTLTQFIGEWTGSAGETSRPGRLITSLLFLLSLGMLVYSVHGERPPGFFDPGANGGKDRS